MNVSAIPTCEPEDRVPRRGGAVWVAAIWAAWVTGPLVIVWLVVAWLSFPMASTLYFIRASPEEGLIEVLSLGCMDAAIAFALTVWVHPFRKISAAWMAFMIGGAAGACATILIHQTLGTILIHQTLGPLPLWSAMTTAIAPALVASFSVRRLRHRRDARAAWYSLGKPSLLIGGMISMVGTHLW